MKEEEAAGPVLLVELVDPPLRGVEYHGFALERCPIGVRVVAEEREVEVRVAVGQEAHLEIVEQGEQPRLGVDDRGNRHDRPVFRGMPSRMASFGNWRGGTSAVMIRWSTLMTSSLTGSSTTSATTSSSASVALRRAAYNEQAGHAQQRRRGDRAR